MLGVMGSLGLGEGSDLACERFTPSSTYSSRGIVFCANGSPRPCWIWANLRPERYDLIVLCFSADCQDARHTYRVCLPEVGRGGKGLLVGRMLSSGAGLICILSGLMEQCRL